LPLPVTPTAAAATAAADDADGNVSLDACTAGATDEHDDDLISSVVDLQPRN